MYPNLKLNLSRRQNEIPILIRFNQTVLSNLFQKTKKIRAVKLFKLFWIKWNQERIVVINIVNKKISSPSLVHFVRRVIVWSTGLQLLMNVINSEYKIKPLCVPYAIRLSNIILTPILQIMKSGRYIVLRNAMKLNTNRKNGKNNYVQLINAVQNSNKSIFMNARAAERMFA